MDDIVSAMLIYIYMYHMILYHIYLHSGINNSGINDVYIYIFSSGINSG